MNQHEELELLHLACEARMHVLTSVFNAASGHLGGSLSSMDVLIWLYFRQLHIDPAKPDDPLRDRFVLSKGHAAPALYTVLAQRGFFPLSELATLRKWHSRLQGHPNMNALPGIDMTTGSLGQGASAAAGMALAAKLSGQAYRVYALLGDGELQEGQVWEAFLFAAHHQLANLCYIIDRNRLQLDGSTEQIIHLEPLQEKLTSFGLAVHTADGHNFPALQETFGSIQKEKGPSAIILNTVKGKGISFMENLSQWHGKAPNAAEYEQAMQELQTKLAELEERYANLAS